MSHGTDEISAVHVVIVVKKQATISNIVLAEESLRNSMCDGLISSGRSVVVRCSPLLLSTMSFFQNIKEFRGRSLKKGRRRAEELASLSKNQISQDGSKKLDSKEKMGKLV